MSYTESEVKELLADQRNACGNAYVAYIARTKPSDWDDHDVIFEINMAKINIEEDLGT